METSTDLFINVIRRNRIIYDKSSKDFKNVNKKEDAWFYIAQECRMTLENAKKRYFFLRQKYTREKKKEELKSRKSGSQAKNPVSWVWCNRLSFLDPYITPRNTYTNDKDNDIQSDVDETEGMIGDSPEIPPRSVSEEHWSVVEEPNQNYSDEVALSLQGNQFHDQSYGSSGTATLSQAVLEDNHATPFQNSSTVPSAVSTDYGDIYHRRSSFVARSESRQSTSTDTFSLPEQMFRENVDFSRESPSGRCLRESSRDGSSSRSGQTASRASSSATITSRGKQGGNERVPNIAEIKSKMNSFLTSATNKLQEKPVRSPHSTFLSFIGSELDRVAPEKLQFLKKDMLDLVFKYSMSTGNGNSNAVE